MDNCVVVSSENISDTIKPGIDDAGKRLDSFLVERVEGWSRARLQKLIDGGDVLVNERPAKASYKLKDGDEIDIDLTEEPAAKFEPENIPLDIVFEDEYLAVVNKPAGMVVHPGAGVSHGTLANLIAWHFNLQKLARSKGDVTILESGKRNADFMPKPAQSKRDTELPKPARSNGDTANVEYIALTDVWASATEYRVGIVHRLDKDTSGLIVVAKDERTHEALAEQFRDRRVYKSYITLVHGSPRENSGTIDRPIARDRWHRTKMTVAANGRNALSKWKVRRRFQKFTLLDVEIKTGRTHQIRVHLASINHPVVGDATYNEGRDNTVADIDVRNAIQSLGRQFLHAAHLTFTHPTTGERLSFSLPMPEELDRLLRVIS